MLLRLGEEWLSPGLPRDYIIAPMFHTSGGLMYLTDWQLSADGSPSSWRPVAVPGPWEDAGVPKDHPGPLWYRAAVTPPPAWAGRRLWLRFGAVSYSCQVYINGELCGEHTGAWDPFAVEITGHALPGAAAELRLRVEKPASLTAGPASPPVPGAFPLKTTLSGFLPYVWGHMFGGVWQPVELVSTGQVIFTDAHAHGGPDGTVEVTAALSGPATVTLELYDPDGVLVHTATAASAEDGVND
ncbi:MAG: hypothetical protein RLZZ387_1858, partial [Chloroflexota bacterium]